jgi:EpsI family protein
MSSPPEQRIANRRAWLASGLMLGTALLGQSLVPTRRLAELRGPFKLGGLVPTTFGEWRLDPYSGNAVVNPQTTALLARLYSQILERVYIGPKGERVMLSIAYGDDQTDPSVQLHYPEVCYPAQGFQIKRSWTDTLQTPRGAIAVRRMETELGRERPEAVTYWTMIGDQQSLGGWSHKKAELMHGFRGEIVDGLLFRVSSLSLDSGPAFVLQDRFVTDLVHALGASARMQLTGLD